ncbi:MAG: glycosyl hydrolase [Candidatus Pelagibacter sp.]|nr:glycosyl hydrolase [Candidatus Pelagibacter sp.]|tara:strand:- start:423 stop:1367 length:945 start_codon:yes stop_codon:yes gene_type:complete
MKKKALIIGIKGKILNKIEKQILSKENPWGVILFERNFDSFSQAKKLTESIRKNSRDKNLPILIDEEGGRVSRLNKLICNQITQKYFGDFYNTNHKLAKKLMINYLKSVIKIIKKLGININTVPVLDILYKNSSNVIGNRSFSNNKVIVSELGNIYLDVYKKLKIGTVIKHIPGHGLAKNDSHKKLPVIKEKISYLLKNDFACFKGKDSFFAMTGHLLFYNLDDKYCVTHSKKIIKEIIRNKIGFKGILISDDISMRALKFDLFNNAIKSLNAGCNIVLYCEPKPKKSLSLIKKIPYIDNFTQKKTSQFYKFLR